MTTTDQQQSGNPVADELTGLSPAAKTALVLGIKSHITGMAPPVDTSAPPSAGPVPGAIPLPTPVRRPVIPGGISTGNIPTDPAMSAGNEMADASATKVPGAIPVPAKYTPMATPMQDRYAQLAQSPSRIGGIHNPWGRVPLQVLDTIGRIALPGLERAIPGTEGYHEQKVAQAENAAKEEQGANTAKATQERETATAEHERGETASLHYENMLKEAQAGDFEAQAYLRAHPPSTYEVLPEPLLNPATGKHETAMVSKTDPKDVRFLGEPGAKPVAPKEPTNEFEKFFQDNPKATSEDWSKFQAAHPKPVEWSAEDAALLKAAGGDPSKPESQTYDVMKKYEDLKKERISVGADHGVSFIDPTTHKLVRVEPGGTVPEGARTAAGENAINTPTMTQRTAAGRAQTVHEMMPEVLSNIEAMKDKIGAFSGRWNKFMQGEIGADDPDMAGLRANLLMTSSAMALAHAQGRLPENLREEFDRAINAPKQSAANLEATLKKMDPWLEKMMEQGGKAASADTGGAAPKTVNTKAEYDALPKGTKYIDANGVPGTKK
jgi:hypothetical protein